MYSKYEYLESIFFDAILHDEFADEDNSVPSDKKYEKIGGYEVRDYRERPHEYLDNEKPKNQ